MTVDKQKLRELASKATPRITLALGYGTGEPTPAEQFYAAALTAIPALLDEIERLRGLALKACDIADRLDNYVVKFPADGGPTSTQRRLVEIREEVTRG